MTLPLARTQPGRKSDFNSPLRQKALAEGACGDWAARDLPPNSDSDPYS